MMQMEALFKEHSQNLQPYIVSIEKSQTLEEYYNNRYSYQQYQYQKSVMPVLPNRFQTCKMQAQSTKELQEIEF